MADLHLPFWVVTDRMVQAPSSHKPRDNPKSIHAFTSTEKLTDFLNGRAAESWKVSLVAHREAFVFAIADAHWNGATVICFGPDGDEAGGESIKLVDLLALVDALAVKAA